MSQLDLLDPAVLLRVDPAGSYPVPTVQPLDALARKANEAHKAYELARREALHYVREAGQALLEAKRQCRHGEFGGWCRDNLRFSERRAQHYMAFAKTKTSSDLDADWTAWMTISGAPSARKSASTPTFDRTAAEHALTLADLSERGVGGEAENAARALETFARGYGLVGEEAVEKARKLLPNRGKTEGQIALEREQAKDAKWRAADDVRQGSGWHHRARFPPKNPRRHPHRGRNTLPPLPPTPRDVLPATTPGPLQAPSRHPLGSHWRGTRGMPSGRPQEPAQSHGAGPAG